MGSPRSGRAVSSVTRWLTFILTVGCSKKTIGPPDSFEDSSRVKRLSVKPIRKGRIILREPVGTLKLRADDLARSLAPLCDVVVMKNRITTVTISVLEQPPRCLCRFNGTDSKATVDHTCVS